MSTNSDKNIPILPYDITYGERITIYQQMQYIRDRDLSERVGIRKESGNIYKYYTAKDAKPIKVGENQPNSDKE